MNGVRREGRVDEEKTRGKVSEEQNDEDARFLLCKYRELYGRI